MRSQVRVPAQPKSFQDLITASFRPPVSSSYLLGGIFFKNLEFFLLLNGGLLADGYLLLVHIPPSRLRTTHARSHIYLISYA